MRSATARLVTAFAIALLGLVILSQCGGRSGSDTLPVSTSSGEALAEFRTGQGYFDNVQFHEAQSHFQKAVKIDPQFALAYLYLALSNPSAKGFIENINLASKHALKASEGERLLIEANLAGANGDAPRQTELLVKLATSYPHDECMLMFLAWQYFGQQQYDSAISVCERVVKISPDHAPAYNILGYSYRFLEKNDEAGRAFKEYIRLKPNDPNPYDSYAELLMNQGQFEQAIEQYRLALQQDRSFAASRFGIASNLMYLGRYDEARRELQAIRDSATDSGQRRIAILGAAVSYIDQGDLEQGLAKLEELHQFDVAIPDPLTAAGDLTQMLPLLVRLGRFDEAKAKLDKALELIDNSQSFERLKRNAHTDTYLWHAVIYVWQGKLAEARQQTDAYLREVDPDKDAARIRGAYSIMGTISIGEKDYDRAIAELDQADPNQPFTTYYLAEAYEGKGDNAKAASLYKELAQSYQLNSVNYALVRREATAKAAELSGSPMP
jgi:tetratricopeptide (TPR) repeat protein